MSKQLWVGTRKGLFTIEKPNPKTAWEISAAAFVGDNISMLLDDPRDHTLYAALDHGHFGVKFQRSSNRGATWEEVGVPTYPEPNPDDPDLDPFTGKVRPWTLNKVWALESGGIDQPGLLWCGTIPGGLFKSTDRGETWTLAEGLWNHPKRRFWMGGGADQPGIHSICVDPRDHDHLMVGVSCGGIWNSTDAGKTWECRADGMRAAYMPPDRQDDPHVQDPHRVVRCRTAPDTLWSQHHNGIFKTTDGAASWHEVKNVPPSSFGFGVAVHPDDPDVAWFVPGLCDEKRIPVDGKLVVTRTRDGGKTFDVLDQGLPGKHAYDIVYRHALEIDHEGETLAIGSTTGSLWISEDDGDSWQEVSEHLPPIYCARFSKAG